MANHSGTDASPKAQEVMDYLTVHELTQRLNDIVNNTIRARADDPFAYMAQQFLAIAQPPTVSHIAVSNILDQGGRFRSLQADVFSWQPSSFVHMGRAVWQTASEDESVDELGVLITNQLKLKALKSESLGELDQVLSDLKEPNAAAVVPAVSIALSRAVAHATRQDLYLFLHKRSNPDKLPNAVVSLPLVDIVKSATLAFGSFGAVPTSRDFPLRQFYRAVHEMGKLVQIRLDVKDGSGADLDKAESLLRLLEQGIKASNMMVGDHVSLWLDAAANSMFDSDTGEYNIGGGATVSGDELLAQYETMVTQHQSLAFIIDPFHHSDTKGWERFAQAMEGRCAAVSSSDAVIGGSLPSLSFHTTVSDYLNAAGVFKNAQQDFVVQMQSSQSDDALADLAVAVSAKYCRFGMLGQGCNSNLYNRLMQIEESIKSQ